MTRVSNVQFEHYHPPNTLGVEETRPRISWQFANLSPNFRQTAYEIEVSTLPPNSQTTILSTEKRVSSSSYLVPWPLSRPVTSRQRVFVRVKVWDQDANATSWSEPAYLEAGLLNRSDWHCGRIAAPWSPDRSGPGPEELYRKEFWLSDRPAMGRLYISAQGVYEAEINGKRVGDHFMPPGWTAYDARIQYQTYDVTEVLQQGDNCIGVRVAEGWFCGRIGFEGGHRGIWGRHTALLVQVEATMANGEVQIIRSDGSWEVAQGPIHAEIYDGEKYDATREIPSWSSAGSVTGDDARWSPVLLMPNLPDSVKLTAGYGEPVRRMQIIKPVSILTSPSGKTIVDFNQNLVGYVRLRNIKESAGHRITLCHAEVLEHGELCTRTLRICKAVDEYTSNGDQNQEFSPRFTFHGFRYVQIDGWTTDDLEHSIEAVVCHTDMKPAGSFSCSNPLLDQLFKNIRWGMRGNFFSVPTDCPQRDERLGWTGDLALFAPTAVLIYDCFNFIKSWLIDVEHDQMVLGGVPPMVSPNATLPDSVWCRRVPCAIWHDVTILAPWTLYEETGDISILALQYNSMMTWMQRLPRNSTGATHLWDTSVFQLGDWLDPAATPHAPWKGVTDARLVANAFLIQSLDLMARISDLLGRTTDHDYFLSEFQAARREFQAEYVTANGRIVSDSQTAYSLAICFDLLTSTQREHAGARLAHLVRKNQFQIGTGFAGTPFVCEALAQTGHLQIAYMMLLEKSCPSWLYPVTMGATTVWERWDGILPDGSVNPGEMTSFNHYAFGAVGKFLFVRVTGLQRVSPGWKRFRVAPSIGAEISNAAAEHLTPFGMISSEWRTERAEKGHETMRLKVSVPYGTTCDVVLPGENGSLLETVSFGDWEFETRFKRNYEWPVRPLPAKTN